MQSRGDIFAYNIPLGPWWSPWKVLCAVSHWLFTAKLQNSEERLSWPWCVGTRFLLRWSQANWEVQTRFFSSAQHPEDARPKPHGGNIHQHGTSDERLSGPSNAPGQCVTRIVAALYLCQGTRTVGWFLAYLCSWKMLRLCIQYISALLSWLTSFLPTEKTQGTMCQEQKSPERSHSGELLIPLGWKECLSYRDGCGVCPSALTRNSRFAPVGRRNQNLFISCSIIDLKIQTCKVTYIKPAIPYAQHIPEHQTHESLQLYS